MFKTITKAQIIGLIIGLVSSFICFFGEYNSWFKHLDIKGHSFHGAILAIVFLGLLVSRNIIDYKSMNKFDKLFTIVVQLFIFGALFSLILAAKSIAEVMIDAIAITFIITMLMFGMRGLCKLAILITLFILFILRMDYISKCMQFTGFVVVIMWFISFYLQETLNIDQLKSEIALLWGKSSKMIGNTLEQSCNDLEKVGNMVQAKTGIQIPTSNSEPVLIDAKNVTAIDMSTNLDTAEMTYMSDNTIIEDVIQKPEPCTTLQTDSTLETPSNPQSNFFDILFFRGKCSRKEYAISFFPCFVIFIISLVISLPFFKFLLLSLSLIIMLSQGTRRCRDCGISIWAHLIPLCPLYLMIKK